MESKIRRKVTHSGTFLVIRVQARKVIIRQSCWASGLTASAISNRDKVNGYAHDKFLFRRRILLKIGYKSIGILRRRRDIISYGESLIRMHSKII